MTNTDAKKIVKMGSIIFLLLFIIVFGFFTSKDVIFGVKIKDVNMSVDGLPIQEGTKVVNNIIKITGNARNAINLILNNREISVDQKGNFNETIALLPGYNTINIEAKDEFGNADEKIYKLMY
ncbi:MAG: hypothetical protein UR25_C0005G0037 [Candidatus Nomurabacteria bacterium GW2011_GWE1_32_28]|uniref:Uncharacterized protein n=1 Tax=Candidatus Nomurabacteria bacterium GW2011_GWF1_31_48 TaxID=1618767 RepID=A0A0F9YE92_9BACT|nr:MAG: hypothetical protein UR10_C0003G0235 [Candidatus Nomurabacteria bacterium GW2011_GWF2_30_133]KKP28454.1 MAG: hypothetical protein UR18_C0004G0036 [Candidatus Nomurabacteria bacterium GW2011_GWE2_31_40]KKP30034.1 MAG: hypothetical protein UR19_C0005G0036 [Candidatus Nomurabacteria bacterium GW2011_GWF1_31_48]KKP34553.1 MAG: hypothetical protein UR25_C0005G0037 [Candidatus Nomurabacteria bacterium GW2011_GWE1_32_28]HAS81049.1 hypothetical protein [Candidatus Nomurabacteria bacterium]